MSALNTYKPRRRRRNNAPPERKRVDILDVVAQTPKAVLLLIAHPRDRMLKEQHWVPRSQILGEIVNRDAEKYVDLTMWWCRQKGWV